MKKFCGRWEFGNCSRKLDCWKIFDKYFGKPLTLGFAVLQRKGVQVSLCMVYTLARKNWGHSYDS